MSGSNGKHPQAVDAPAREPERVPEEIAAYERATDPYANMLPGISSIRAAETIGRGVQVGRRGNRKIMALSVFMLLALLLPLILAVVSHFVH